MKKLIMLSVAVLAASLSFAQTLYVPGGTSGIVNNTANGNVGIGIASPSNLLHLYSATTSPYLRLERSGAQYEVGVLFTTSNTPDFYFYIDNVTNSHLQIQASGLSGEDDGYPRMRIPRYNKDIYLALSGGTVGIGTTNTGNVKLALHGTDDTYSLIRMTNNGNAAYGVQFGNVTYNSKDAEAWNSENGYFRIATNNAERLRVLANGNVGIGTTNPGAKFEVNGNLNVGSDLSSTATQNATYGKLLYFLGAHNNSDPLWMARYNVSGNPNASELRVNIGDDPTHNGDKFVIGVQSGSWNPRLVVQGDGKVGIGTETMGSHKLAVEGSIGAREIKVEVSGWSDFVFEEDYTLRPLEEVETYIAENKHLPEIPSEAEVTENGINLGEMNAKLLQKIEELTLYLIEQNKQNQAQQTEIENLSNELNSLKKQ